MKDVLLDLQNSFSCNVLTMLWCIWIEKSGITVTCEQQSECELLLDDYSNRWLVNVRKQRLAVAEQSYLSSRKKSIEQYLLKAEIECELAILELIETHTQTFIKLNSFAEPLSCELSKARSLSSYLERHFETSCIDGQVMNKRKYQRLEQDLLRFVELDSKA